MTDDTEGWGRLNLFKAANGFGEFLNDTTVNMDASKGGFNAVDTWKNNISGNGGLTKEGTGSLSLLGNNSYKGGTTVKGGTLVAENDSALGHGSFKLSDGKLTLSAKNVVVKGNYTQSKQGTLNVNANDKVSVSGTAKLGGKLVIKNVKGLKSGVVILKSNKLSGKFAHHALPKGWHLDYTKHSVKLVK